MRLGKLLIIPSIFFFSGFSFATTQPLVTIGELEAQQNRNILLQAKVQGAQLQKQLEESDVTSSSETVSGFSGVTASLPSVSEQPTSKNRKELPIIMEINGKDKRLNAVLRMADGRQTSVTTGSQLPGTSVTVKSISLSGVTLSDGTTLTGFAPIFPDTCYHLTHYWPAAADIPVASDNPVHYADAIRYNARTPLQGSLLPLTRLV